MRALMFITLALAAFRVTRLVTIDEFSPSEWFREKITERFGAYSSWVTLFTCCWCFGAWCSIILVTFTHHFVYDIIRDEVLSPFGVLALVTAAISSLVGYLGTYDER